MRFVRYLWDYSGVTRASVAVIAGMLLCLALTTLVLALVLPAIAGAQEPTRIVSILWSADSHLPTSFGTYLVEHGPLPMVTRGRIALLACDSNTCERYTVTVVGTCRIWAVGATVVEDTPCLYLPVVRHGG